MALSINPATKVITIPQADLSLVTGSLYELNTDQFRRDVAALLDDEDYIWMDYAFTHNTEVTVAGTTFARTIEFINSWSIEFEDGTYSVRLSGSNNNLFDVENGILVQNTVQVIAQNSAGLVNTTTATVAEMFSTEIEPEGSITMQQTLQTILAVLAGQTVDGGATFKTSDGAKTRVTATVNPSNERTSITLSFT